LGDFDSIGEAVVEVRDLRKLLFRLALHCSSNGPNAGGFFAIVSRLCHQQICVAHGFVMSGQYVADLGHALCSEE
jgi:hypothetical protein